MHSETIALLTSSWGPRVVNWISTASNRAKRAARVIASGEPSKYVADEDVGFLFTAMRPGADNSLSAGRLSVIVPSLSANSAFGGLSTHVELSVLVYNHFLKERGWKLRFICTGGEPSPGDNICDQFLDADESIEYIFRAGNGVIPVSKFDVFFGSLWFNYFDALPLMNFQGETFDRPPPSYVSLVQDYEAGFHPWSSAYMMCTAFYDTPGCVQIFNSAELRDFYVSNGHPAPEHVCFSPVMNNRLSRLRSSLFGQEKDRQLLVYARPHERRNCFYILRRALEIWSRSYPGANRWKVVAVGAANVRMDLDRRVQWENKSKLTIEDYAAELAKSAVGVSLMASPHPSYPPLEMAHYGALTISNAFKCKNLSKWHDNITSIQSLTPEVVALRMAEACDKFEADPLTGYRGESHVPSYLNEHSQSTVSAIGELIHSRL